ncbi:hypothetical protein CDD83_1582 [Cordyceps sp. RAO-2017]|nr:hypothetical protein CDD83_1582 [Cordyceps sp. RAO-2017]
MAAVAAAAPAGIYAEPRRSPTGCYGFTYDYESSVDNDEANEAAASASASDQPRRPSEQLRQRRWSRRWLGHVKEWLSVSEPSAQAMKAQKKTAYKKYGIESDDPRAAAKMHLPIGKVPAGVTTSTAGPSPERALRERTRENTAKQSYLNHHESLSVSSGISSQGSAKGGISQVAPWA